MARLGISRQASGWLAAALLALSAAGAVTAAQRRPARARTGSASPKPKRQLPALPPARPVFSLPGRGGAQASALEKRVEQLERALAESQARERQTATKLQEVEVLVGTANAGGGDTVARLTTLVDLYRRLEKIDRELDQLRDSASPGSPSVKELEAEQEAIFKWFRAAVGDPGPVTVVKKHEPTPEMLRAVDLARAEAAAAERELNVVRQGVGQGLRRRETLLQAQSEVAHARANLARAEARVKGDLASEIAAAKAQLAAVEADQARADADVRRLTNLPTSAVAAAEVSAAQARLRKARAAVEAASSEVKRLEEQQAKDGEKKPG